MQIPLNCPICSSSMQYEFKEVNVPKNPSLIKFCNKIDHSLAFYTNVQYEKLNLVTAVRLIVKKHNIYIWNLESKTLIFYEAPPGPSIELFFFYPDFSNFPALLNKINTYITFL